MKQLASLLRWTLKAALFFTLFAFALNNQHDSTVHFFFGTQWRAPQVLVVLTAFALGLANGRLLWLSLLLFPSVLAGNWLGAKSFGKVPPSLWRSFVAGILGLAGISALIRLFN